MLHNIAEEQISCDNFMMQTLVSLCVVEFRAVCYGAVQFKAS